MNGYLKPIMPLRAFERATDQIANAIRMGEIREGDRLPSERDIAATMEISRPSLRSALRVLEEAGVIEVRPGSAGGIFVASTMLPRTLLRPPTIMTPDEVGAALESRRLFEPRVAHLAAVRATQEDFDRMQRTIDEQAAMLVGDPVGSAENFSCQGLHFHMRMAGATHNSMIVAMSRRLHETLGTVRELAGGAMERRRSTLEMHERTLSAIRSADHEQIDRVMEEHISALEIAWERKSARPLQRELPDFLVPTVPGPSAARQPEDR